MRKQSNWLKSVDSPITLTDKLKQQGTLRILLQLVGVVFILVLPFAEPAWHPSGLDMLLGAVIPAMAPIIFILLMLDVLMCSVWKADSEDEDEVARLGFAIKTHLAVGFVLIAFWIGAIQDALFA